MKQGDRRDDNASRWKVLAPDLATPSTEVALSDDHTHCFSLATIRPSGRIQSGGHVLRRDLVASTI